MTKRALLCWFVGASLLCADTLVLRDGTRIEGSFLGGDNRNIRFDDGQRVNSYNLNNVRSIQFTNDQSSNDQQNQSDRQPPDQRPPDQRQSDQRPGEFQRAQTNPPPRYPGPDSASSGNSPAEVQVPSGTPVVIRLIDPVNSETDSLGQTYRASLDQPIIVNGQTVVPRGADAVATLIDAQKSGRIQGKTVMTLDLKSLTVNGRKYDISTTGVSQASASRGQRSAKVIGGTAVLGAVIGAIAGGGKGAAIGTVAGAGAGTAAEVATSGQKVKVPAETRLTFTLQNPLNL